MVDRLRLIVYLSSDSKCSVTGAFMALVPEKYKCRQFLNPILSK